MRETTAHPVGTVFSQLKGRRPAALSGFGTPLPSQPFALIYAGSSWSVTTSLGFAGTDLGSISCPSTIVCMAVGDEGAVTWNGASAPA